MCVNVGNDHESETLAEMVKLEIASQVMWPQFEQRLTTRPSKHLGPGPISLTDPMLSSRPYPGLHHL